MRNIMKRLTAVLLVVCTLASFVVPATFADTAEDSQTKYIFDLANSTDPKISAYNWGGNKLNKAMLRADGTTDSKTGWQILSDLYTEGSLNWKGEAYSTTVEQTKFDKDKGGLFTYVAPAQNTGYLALRLAAPKGGAGEYTVSLTSVDARNTIDVYLVDAAEYTTVEDAISVENKILSGIITNATHTTENPVAVAGGEMILVLHMVTIHATKSRHIISNITFTKVDSQGETTPGTTSAATGESTEGSTEGSTGESTSQESFTYDLEVFNDDRYASLFNNADKYYSSIKTDLINAYESGDLNWKFEAVGGDIGEDNLLFRASTNDGVRIQKPKDKDNAGWVAIRLRVPTADKYDLSLTMEASWYNHDVYFFAADDQTMLEDALLSNLKEETQIGSQDYISNYSPANPYTATYEDIDITDAGEYILAMRMKKNLAKSTMYLSNIVLTPVVADTTPTDGSTVETTTQTTTPESTPETTPESTPETTTSGSETEKLYTDFVYDFEVYNYDRYKPMVENKKTYALSSGPAKVLEGVYDSTMKSYQILDADYPNVLNWKVEGIDSSMKYANLTLYVEANTGMRIQKPENTMGSGWIAFRIAAPQGGAYDLYAVTEASWSAHNVYVFPAASGTMSETELESKMTDQYLVGTPKATANNTVDAPHIESYTNINLATAGEYIVVFKMPETDGKTTIYLSGLALFPAGTGDGPNDGSDQESSEPESSEPANVGDKLYTDNVYNFELYQYDRYLPMIGDRDTFALSRGAEGKLEGVYNTGKIASELLNADYPNLLNWKVAGMDSSMNYANLTLYVEANTGMRIQKPATDQAENGWVAFRILVPQSGLYDLKATTESSWGAHSIYVFPAASGTMSEADLEGKMTDANLVGTAGETSKHTPEAPFTKAYRNIELAAGEYIVVFKMQASVGKTTIYLSNLALTPATGEVDPTEPTQKPVELIPGGATKENFFDIELYHYEAFSHMAGTDSRYDSVANLLKNSYPDKVNWLVEGYPEDADIRFHGENEYGMRAEIGAHNYIALRVNIAKAADYHIVFKSTYKSYQYNATVYMVPAPESTMTPEQIKAAINDTNKIGSYSHTYSVQNAAILNQKVEKAGEYVLILVAGDNVNSEKKGRIYLSSIEFKDANAKESKQEQDRVVYDFNLYGLGEGITQRSLTNKISDENPVVISEKLAELYDAGKVQWKYEGKSETAIVEAIRETYLRFKSTVDMIEVKDGWNAFRLRAPGTGVYDVRLTGVEKNTAVVNFYLIPAVTGVTMTAEQIKAGMVKENLLIEKARLSGEGTFYLGEYDFGVEIEYVMVLEFVRGSRLNLAKMEMTKDGLVADGERPVGKTYSGVVYDLDLADPFEGPFYGKSSFYMADVYDKMQARWKSGAQNWMWVGASDSLVASDPDGNVIPGSRLRFYREGGMYVYVNNDENAWVALKIKSPGSGDFTVTLNHAICPDSGTVAMYVLPADTDLNNPLKATDPSNRIGMATLTNDTGLAGKEDGYSSFVGYYNFEAGKEYILLLECYATSKYNNLSANMNLSQIIMEKGIKEYKQPEEEKVVNPIPVAESIVSVADSGAGNFAMFEMDGMDYYLVQLEGGNLYLYNMDTKELEDFHYIPGSRPRHMQVAADGKVWITNAWKYLVCYDPVEKTYEKTRTYLPSEFKHNGFSYMTLDENGIIYAAMNNIGHVVKYDPVKKIYTDLGVIRGVTDSIGALLYKDGYLYIQCVQKSEYNCVVKYNIATGKTEGICEFVDLCGNVQAYGIGMLGEDILAVGITTVDNNCAITIDINTMELVDLGLPGSVNYCVSEEIDGKQYIVCNSYGLYEYDVATGVVTKVPGFTSMSASGFRSGAMAGGHGKSWATIDGDFCLVSNLSSKYCSPRVINMTKKEYYEWRELVKDATGGGSEIISLTNGAEGANEVIAGFWNAHFAATYNTETGTVTNITETAGQTDTIGFYKGILYAGCYSATVLVELNRETNDYTQRFKLDHEITKQKRLFSIEFGDDKVFVGSIPDTNYNGGSLTVYDTLTGQWYSERNLIPDQSIIDEAYWNKVVFITSSRAGGSNTQAMGGDAVILAYDYENRKTLATLDITKYIPNLPRPVEFMYGLTADPNAEENGRIWAVVADTLFCFTFDKETNTFDVQTVLSFPRTRYNTSGGVGRQQSKLQFIEEKNQLYVVFKDSGTYCITLEDWNAPVGKVKIAEKERIMSYRPEDFIIGHDGNMYFGEGGDLMMLPLNVTQEDWDIAQNVDDLINAIGNEITLESETAIKNARSAYENLSWYYKSLVQKMNVLEEAEADLLECKIAAWEGKEVTADDVDALYELVEIYKPLNVRQKRYVKNYELLRDSYDLASDLNNQRVAAAMQKKVDALAELFPIETLEKEPQVVAVREELNSLTGAQQYLVDKTILEEAEAQIAVLRAEFIKQVEALIQAIPAEITLEAEPAIVAAREGVDKLYALERKQVSYSKLESAEAKLRNLKNALEKAQEVDALIKAIGIVTLGDKDRIAEARMYYNALNETARGFVTKYGKLRRAEFILSALQSWGIPVIVVADLGIAFAIVWFVPSLHSKVFKSKKKEKVDETTES